MLSLSNTVWSSQKFQELKSSIHRCCLDLLADKLTRIKQDLEALHTAIQQDQKSSMGDKYETGPALLHQQRQQLLQQERQLASHHQALQQLTPHANQKSVEPGCLISTNHGLFYVSIGLGRVVCKEQEVWAISLQSPLGKSLHQRKAGDEVNFQGRSYNLKQLV